MDYVVFKQKLLVRVTFGLVPSLLWTSGSSSEKWGLILAFTTWLWQGAGGAGQIKSQHCGLHSSRFIKPHSNVAR